MKTRRTKVQTIAVGAACFALASLVVRADTTPVPPGQISAISDGHDQSLRVKVASSGELSASDAGTRSRLDTVNAKLAPLGFDENGLRVSATGHVAVDGTVTVANLPMMQAITGTVAVTNFPATQPVTGTVSIANLPATQNVNVVDGGMQPTFSSYGAARFYLVNDGTLEKDYLAAEASNQPFTTQRFQQLFPRGLQRQVTLITLSSDKDVHLTCRLQGRTMFVLANDAQNQRQEFVHPLLVDECYIECIDHSLQIQPNCQGIFTIAGTTLIPPPMPVQPPNATGGGAGDDPQPVGCSTVNPVACI